MQSGRSFDDRHKSWDQMRALVLRHVPSDPLVVLMDADAASGAADMIHVHVHDDKVAPNTALLREFLDEAALYLPSTTRAHEGDHSTWHSPLDGTAHRIDYVALPTCMADQQALARIFLAWRRRDEEDLGLRFGTALRCRRLHVGCRLYISALDTSDILSERLSSEHLLSWSPADGTPCPSPEALRDRWIDFFRVMEGKTLHRAIRDQQSSVYESFLHSEQLGGRKKVPVGIGLHHARASLRRAKLRGWSSALLFLDLREAFYRIIRPLAVGGAMPDGLLAQIAARLGLDDDALRDLHLLLRTPAATESAGLPLHLQRALRALHTDTHFRMEAQPNRVRTEVGTRPGDPFADVVFGFMFARILHELHDQLAAQGVLEEYQCCFNGLLPQHGVTTNLDKGKSEVLFSFRGAGSRSLRSKYFGASLGQKFPVMTNEGVRQISAVGSYTHTWEEKHTTVERPDRKCGSELLSATLPSTCIARPCCKTLELEPLSAVSCT
eukprot:s676_g13.t1